MHITTALALLATTSIVATGVADARGSLSDVEPDPQAIALAHLSETLDETVDEGPVTQSTDRVRPNHIADVNGANEIIVGLDTVGPDAGSVCIYNDQPTDLIVDVVAATSPD